MKVGNKSRELKRTKVFFLQSEGFLLKLLIVSYFILYTTIKRGFISNINKTHQPNLEKMIDFKNLFKKDQSSFALFFQSV